MWENDRWRRRHFGPCNPTMQRQVDVCRGPSTLEFGAWGTFPAAELKACQRLVLWAGVSANDFGWDRFMIRAIRSGSDLEVLRKHCCCLSNGAMRTGNGETYQCVRMPDPVIHLCASRGNISCIWRSYGIYGYDCSRFLRVVRVMMISSREDFAASVTAQNFASEYSLTSRLIFE
ncbi:hypothetical protein BDV09DRAFT_167670 [Aspergillus tetrazonus]